MRLDRILLAFIAVIFAVHFLGTALSWYSLYPWLDIPMHIAGGAWVGLLFLYLFLERRALLPANMNFISLALLGLGFVALVGVGWEFYEYLSYVFLLRAIPFAGSVPGLYFDTLKDLFDDLLGGSLAIFGYIRLRRIRS